MKKLFLIVFSTSFLLVALGCVTTPNTADLLDNIMENWISAFNNEDSNTLIKYFLDDAVRIRNNADKPQEIFHGVNQILKDTKFLFEKIDASLFNYELTEKDLSSDPELPKYMYVVDMPVNKIEHTFIFKKINRQWGIIKHILIITVK